MGPLSFLMPRFAEVFGWDKIRSVSRPEGASPATGSHKAHGLEQRTLLDEAFASDKE
jgi:2-oxoglutarate dehydrogenase E1 component